MHLQIFLRILLKSVVICSAIRRKIRASHQGFFFRRGRGERIESNSLGFAAPRLRLRKIPILEKSEPRFDYFYSTFIQFQAARAAVACVRLPFRRLIAFSGVVAFAAAGGAGWSSAPSFLLRLGFVIPEKSVSMKNTTHAVFLGIGRTLKNV